MRLERFFGASAQFWLGLQALHDLTRAKLEIGAAIEKDVRPRAA